MTSDEGQKGVKRKSTSPDHSDDVNLQLDEAAEYIVSRTTKQKARGNLVLQLALEKVEEVASQSGLPADIISQLVDIAAADVFPISLKTKLIKCLIPASVVPSKAVLKTVSWICTNKPPVNVQTLLIRWLVLMYDNLETTEDLHALYGILFYFLENSAMCRDVCRLLFLLTRKEDVKIFRIRILLRLHKKIGPQPYLLGLLSVYKLYQPRLIVLPKSSMAKVFFRLTDRAWSSRIRAVLDRRRVDRPLEADTSLQKMHLAQSMKKRRAELFPSVQCSLLAPSGETNKPGPGSKSVEEVVPFSQISSFKDLLQNFDRLELPGQISSALKNRNLQHVLLCYPDPTIAMRMAHWLDHVLCEEFLLNPSKDSSRRAELLKMLIKFSQFLKEGVPVCENFLVKYLHIWNGSDFRVEILKLVTRFRLYSFQVLNDLVLEPLRKLYFCSSVYFKCQLLMTITELLRNFALIELPRYRYCVKRQNEVADLNTTALDLPNSHCVFSQEVDHFCAEATISQFIEHVDKLVTVGLQAEKGNSLLMHCVLNFYELVSELHQKYGLPFVILPSRVVMYRALFDINAIALSRICHIICRYRDGFMLLRSVSTSEMSEAHQALRSHSLQKIYYLNRYLLDFCDSLWRNRAFTSQEKGTVYNLVDKKHHERWRGSSLCQSFSLHFHPALIGAVQRYMEKNLPEGVKHHPSIVKRFHDELLRFLDLEHVTGINHFISVNISRKNTSQT